MKIGEKIIINGQKAKRTFYFLNGKKSIVMTIYIFEIKNGHFDFFVKNFFRTM